jgi:hypothetical protein
LDERRGGLMKDPGMGCGNSAGLIDEVLAGDLMKSVSSFAFACRFGSALLSVCTWRTVGWIN